MFHGFEAECAVPVPPALVGGESRADPGPNPADCEDYSRGMPASVSPKISTASAISAGLTVIGGIQRMTS